MIQAGEDILAEDFINESEADPTPANNAGKVVKLESDGKIHADFLPPVEQSYSPVAGHDITGVKAVFVSDASEVGLLPAPDKQETTSSAESFPAGDTNTWFIQQIVIPSGVTSIKAVAINMTKTGNGGGSDDDDFTLSIRSSETGSDIQSNTQNVSSGSGQHWRTFTFGTAATVTPGGTYYIVFRRSSLAGSGYGGFTDGWNGSASGVYSGGRARISTNSGSSWSDTSTVADFSFRLYAAANTAGRVYKAIGDDYTAGVSSKYVGFTKASATGGQACTVITGGVLTGLSGLTAGSLYYLQSDGTIGTGSGTGKKVGIAVSTTELLLNNYA